jgi:hypothetical protein
MMKRILLMFILAIAFAGRALATDVTIGATTQPNFNPSGLAAAVTIAGVTVTNGTNAVLTCANCFRPNWIGLSGFYITVGNGNYYVQSVDNASQATLVGGCPESSPATVTWHPYVEFRIYADRAFQPLGESYIVQPGTPGTGAWYKRYAASVVTVNGVKTLYIPEIVIDATTDAVGPTNQARYTAAFYRPDASLIQVYACADQFRVPPVTPTGWASLCQFNSPPAIVPPANEAYTKTQIDARLISCSTNQMMYFAATGNQPACLNPGTNLTISGGALNVTGVVTSVGLSLPNIFTVSNSPVIATGTLTATLATQAANRVFAGPATGSAAPTFRALVAGDIPSLPYVTSVGLSLPGIFTVTNSPVISSGSLTATLVNQSAKQFFAGPTFGINGTGTPAFRAINEDDLPSVRQAVNAKTDYNCAGDATTTTGSIGSGTTTITSVGSLTGWKVGQGIRIVGAGTAGGDLVTSVQSITAPTTMTVTGAASTTVSGATIHHDDTACLVAAINAAQTGGKKLYLPAGTYNTDAITANVSQMIIEGDGANRTIIKARTSNMNVFNVTTPAYGYGLNLRDLGVRGAGKTTGTTGHCIYIKDSNSYLSEFRFSNLTVADCREDGINIPYIFSGTIDHVSTDQIGEDHFDIGSVGGSNTVTLANNYVKTIGAWRVGYRIRVAGAMMISNNGMAPDSEPTAFWGLFGQKYVTANATMTSGNATLTSVASGGGFNPGDEVWLANGVSAGVHLKTVVTAVNVAGNTVTVLNAPTNSGASVLGTTDGASSGATMTSGNATLTNVTNAGDFVIGNGVKISNGVSAGVTLTTTVTGVNATANTLTLAAAPTNNGATIVAIDGTSYYRAAFLNNNIEDFGSYGIRLKEFSRFGSISGNNFLTSPAAIPHIALKYDYAGAGFDGSGGGTTPAGFWDSTNVLTLASGGGSWANGQPIHSQAVPFLVAGEQPKQYYETSFGFAVDLPALASSWDSTEAKMLLQIPGTGTDNLKLGQANSVTGKALFMNAANANRLYLQAGTTSATTTFTLPTAVPAGNDYLLQGSTAGAWSWSNFTGTGDVVRTTSPTLSTPKINSVVFASLPSSPDGTIILCTDCHSSGAGGSGVCASGGPGSLAMRIGGAWICPK